MPKFHAVITTFKNMIVIQSKQLKASTRYEHVVSATPGTLGISDSALRLLDTVKRSDKPTIDLIFTKSGADAPEMSWSGSGITIIDPSQATLSSLFSIPEGSFCAIEDATSAKARQQTTTHIDHMADNSGECELCDGTGTLKIETPFTLGSMKVYSAVPCHVCRKTGTDKNALLKLGKGVRGFKDRLKGDRPSFAKFRPEILLDRVFMMAAVIASNRFDDTCEEYLNIEFTMQSNGNYRIKNAFENARFAIGSTGMIARYFIDHSPEIESQLLEKFEQCSIKGGVIDVKITKAQVENLRPKPSEWKAFKTTLNKMLRDEGEIGSFNFYQVYFIGGLHSAIDAANHSNDRHSAL